LHLGPIPIHVWGLFVAFGVLAATFVAGERSEKKGLSKETMWDIALWSMIGALIGSRLFFVLYEPAYFFAHPFDVFFLWDGGMSMMGGLIGAAIAGVGFIKRHAWDVWGYVDQAFFALPLGIGIGRIGCFLIHDHPGVFTNLFFGVRYPDGLRLDHGLLLSLEGFFLFAVFAFLSRKNVRTGTFLALFLLADGFTRFCLDFFRATDLSVSDIRYAGLTPAQYVAFCMMLFGAWLFWKKIIPKN